LIVLLNSYLIAVCRVESLFTLPKREESLDVNSLSEENGESPDFLEPQDLDEEVIVEEEPLEEVEPADTIFDNDKGFVAKDEADRIAQHGLYGTRLDDGRLELEPVELLHLIERKRITVKTVSGNPIGSKEIVKSLYGTDPNLWIQYLVFRDLRSRGYAVRQGFGGGIGFRVYARGERPGIASADQLIYVLKEGEAISLNDLDMVTETALAARKKLIFGLVDQNGEVNYYRVAQATLRNRGGDTS
jgi:tRNA-intron endonuclease